MSHAEQATSESKEPLADQEVVNTATHAAGFVLSVMATICVVAMARTTETGLAISCLVYTLTLMAVYAVSSISHAVQRPRAKFILRAWDQGVIYLLIAGTYTPFVWAGLAGSMRLIVLALFTALHAIAEVRTAKEVAVLLSMSDNAIERVKNGEVVVEELPASSDKDLALALIALAGPSWRSLPRVSSRSRSRSSRTRS